MPINTSPSPYSPGPVLKNLCRTTAVFLSASCRRLRLTFETGIEFRILPVRHETPTENPDRGSRSGLLIPVEDTQRPQRVPPAGPIIAVLKREVDLARMRVLQQPRTIRLPL